MPIKDQGILKGPVRIGPDTWIATQGDHPAQHDDRPAVACSARTRWSRATSPTISIAVGAPAKVVKNRKLAWETSAAAARGVGRGARGHRAQEGRAR